jgi:hypothetical protein
MERKTTWYRERGLIPETAVRQFYQGDKPELTVVEGKQTVYLSSKWEKDTSKQREKMAVSISSMDVDTLTAKSEHEFLNGILFDYRADVLRKVQAGEVGFETVENVEKLIAFYNDSTRESNRIKKEDVSKWVLDSNLTAYITTRIVAKNAQIGPEKLADALKGYAEMFGKITGYNLTQLFPDNQRKLIRMVLDNTEDDGSEMREWFVAKFEKIEKAHSEENALVDAF